MECRRFLSIPVSAVLLLMGFVYFITVFVFIDDWFGLRSSAGSLNALIFSCLYFLCLLSFFSCVLMDPGHVPASYIPDVEENRRSDEGPDKNVSQSRQCDKCSMYKPPRAHHCRVCRRCVLKMDHHCPWTNNCVGYRNYKAFFILVLYATIGSIYSTVIIIGCSVQKDFGGKSFLKVFYITCGAEMTGLSLMLGTLLGWHFFLIIHNLTTIEYYEERRAKWLARKSGQSYRRPFDLDVYKNITLVFGTNMLKWLCPTAVSHLKDGLAFPVSRDNS